MQITATDPKVSVPIVCGEYMRATGFFYSTEETIYLVTARHSCIPTDCSQLLTGETDLDTKSSCFSPKIDIYLRTDEETVSKRVNILDRPGVYKYLKLILWPFQWISRLMNMVTICGLKLI